MRVWGAGLRAVILVSDGSEVKKGEITLVISLLHVQEWREGGTGVFVGQLGCKVISGKRLKTFMVSAVNDNIPGHGMDTWTLRR